MKNSLMRVKLAIVLLTAPFVAMAQPYFGENWTNVPENLTDEVITLINNQIPVGQTYFACFRNDKYAEDKVQGGVTTPGIDKAPQWEIDQVIKLKNTLETSGKFFGLIYTFDTRGRCSVTDAFFAFDQFVAAGIYIPACRGGNEEYAKVAGHNTFSHYSNLIAPIRTALAARGWTGWFTIPVDRFNSVKQWNTDVVNYCAADPKLIDDIHFYWNEDFSPAFAALQVDANGDRYLPPAKATSAGYLELHDNFYRDAYFEITGSQYFEDQMAWHNANFPGKPCTITEFGPGVGVGPLSGSLGYNAAEDWFYNKAKYRKDIFCALHFNGPNTPTGSCTKKSKYDPAGIGNVIPRLSYYTQAQFRRNINAVAFPSAPIATSGTYTFSVHNMVRSAMNIDAIIPVADGYFIESFDYEYISGANYYSSAGVVQWWTTGSEIRREITGSKYADIIPALSYGYVHVTVKKIPVPGCTNPNALNYNSKADIDDGSCTFPVCKCEDSNASNYNQVVDCANTSPCIYPPPPPVTDCRKKWFEFWKPKCK